MSLNSSSIHGIIVAVVTGLMCLMVILTEITVVRYILTFEDGYGMTLQFALKHVGIFGFALLAALAAVLMTWGIVKKRHTLVIPWLALYFLAAVVFTFMMWSETISNLSQFDDILFGFIIMGLEIIVFYPIYILFADIRIESAARRTDCAALYSQNIQNNFEEFYHKTIL